MLSTKFRRCLSLLLALALTLSLAPFGAFAAEQEGSGTSEEESTQTPPTDAVPAPTEPVNPIIVQAQSDMDALMMKYFGTTTPTPEKLQEKVDAMDWEQYQTARHEISLLDQELSAALEAGKVTEEELLKLIDNNQPFLDFSAALEEKAAADKSVTLYAARTLTFTSGDLSITIMDSEGNGTLSGTTYTCIGKKGTFSGTTNNVTITNTSGCKIDLTFTSNKASGYSNATHTVTLEDKGVITTSVTGGGFLSGDQTLTLSGLSIAKNITDYSVAITHDAGGIVTANGVIKSDTTTTTVSQTSNYSAKWISLSLTAAASSGYDFICWAAPVDSNNDGTAEYYTVLDVNKTYQVPVETVSKVHAIFASAGTGYYMVGAGTGRSEVYYDITIYKSKVDYYTVSSVGSRLFDSLTAANTYAAGQSAQKYIVPLNNATLPAGDYEISSGVTLLIPCEYNSTNGFTGFTTQPKISNAYRTPTAYRTMTLASGANLKVLGSLCVASYISCNNMGAPSGHTISSGVYTGAGVISMAEGSTITVGGTDSSGTARNGTLYAWGFIGGSGSVTVNSGSTVYECFQSTSWRGGSVTTEMTNNDNKGYKVFPLNQFYIQNVQVPMTLHAGALEYCSTSVQASSVKIVQTIPFIGSTNGMFRLSSGRMVKDYIEGTDRTQLDVYGTVSIANLNIAISIMYIISIDLNSADYVLPLTNNFTVNVRGATTHADGATTAASSISVTQDVAMLPGCEIIIESGASATLSSGVSIYVYDVEDWNRYAGNSTEKILPVKAVYKGTSIAAPGIRKSAGLTDAMLKINGTLDGSAGNVYTTSGGANICSDGGGVAKVQPDADGAITYQLIQDSTTLTFNPIPVNSAWLTNVENGAFESFTITKNGATNNTYTYTGNATTGHWYETSADCTHSGITSAVTAATCAQHGYTTHTCTACGLEYIDTLTDKLAHVYTNNDGTPNRSVAGAPTYTAAGYWVYTCVNCPNKYTEPIVVATVGGKNETVLKTAITNSAKYNNTVNLLHSVPLDSNPIAQDVVIIRNGNSCTGISAGAITDKNDVVITQFYLCTSDYAYIITSGTAKFTPDDSICYVSVNGTVLSPADDGSYSFTVSANTSFVTAKHTWNLSTGQCDFCQDWLIRYDAIQLSVESEIQLRLKFKIHSDLLTKYPNAQVYVTEEGNLIEPEKAWNTALSGAAAAAEVESGGYLDLDKDGVRYVVNQGIASGEMTGNVSVQFKTAVDGTLIPFYNKDTQAKAEMLTKKVTDFAEAVYTATKKEGFDAVKSANDELWEMCRWALTYGGYAQQFYFYTDPNVEHPENPYLASDKLTELGSTRPTSTQDGSDGTKKLADYRRTVTAGEGYSGPTASGQRLNLDSKVYLRSYFTMPEGMNLEQVKETYKVKLAVPTNNGEGVGEGANFEWAIDKNGRLYLDIQDIPPAYWNDTFTITITDGSGKTYVLTTSPMTWCASCVQSGEPDKDTDPKRYAQYHMALAMYDYAKAAETYFAEKSKLGN